MFEYKFEGLFTVDLINGSTRNINIVRTIIDTRGEPIFLITHDETMYRWSAIISIKKVEE